MAAPDPENPSACAREALKQLGAKRLPPTPENFARAYFELAPGARAGSALGAADMLRQLAAEWPRREGDGARTLGQLEQSVNIAHVASVKVDTDLLFAHVCIETTGGHSAIHCRGHRKSDALEIKQLIERFQTEYYFAQQ